MVLHPHHHGRRGVGRLGPVAAAALVDEQCRQVEPGGDSLTADAVVETRCLARHGREIGRHQCGTSVTIRERSRSQRPQVLVPHQKLLPRELEGGEAELAPHLLPEHAGRIRNGEFPRLYQALSPVLVVDGAASALEGEDDELLPVPGYQALAARHLLGPGLDVRHLCGAPLVGDDASRRRVLLQGFDVERYECPGHRFMPALYAVGCGQRRGGKDGGHLAPLAS